MNHKNIEAMLMDRGVEGLQTDDWYEIHQAVADAPTIIPAEEGE